MDDRQLTPSRRWPVLPLVAGALAAGALTGGLVVAAGSAPEAAAGPAPATVATPAPATGGVAVGDAALAVRLQALQSALATWALEASLVQSHEASHAAAVVLQRHEASLEGVAAAADALAGDARAVAVARLARAVAAHAAEAREAAHAERTGEAGVLRLRALAGEVQGTSARLSTRLDALAAAPDAAAYEAALAAAIDEVERSVPAGLPAPAPAGGPVPGDDPVPAAP